MKSVFDKFGLLFSVACVILLFDQWTKWLVRSTLPFGSSWMPESLNWLSPYARIVHWHNTGAAFGMFQNGSMIFTVLAFIVIGAIIYYFPQVEKTDWTLRLAMSMQMGGAFGNLTDRILREGRVTDFISVGTFPVFNVADASISVGTVILLLGVYLQERTAKWEQESLNSSNQTGETTSE